LIAPEVKIDFLQVGFDFVGAVTDESDVLGGVVACGVKPIYREVGAASVATVGMTFVEHPCEG
jgi:hypothetical protein